MKLEEIAARIDAHLKRFERDPKINKPEKTFSGMPLHPYYRARAYRAGPRVGVVYINYSGARNLTKAEAIEYLAWLDAGNVGTHHQALTVPTKSHV